MSEAQAAVQPLARAAEAVRQISVGLTTPEHPVQRSRRNVAPLRSPYGARDAIHQELVAILRTETRFDRLLERLSDLKASAKETGAREASQHLAEYMESQARHLRAVTTTRR